MSEMKLRQVAYWSR